MRMSSNAAASALPSNSVSAQSEVIGLVALAISLLAIGKWSYWFLPNAHWQRCVIALLVCSIEIGLPCFLAWRRPATASFEGLWLVGGITSWLLAFPLLVTLLLADTACRPYTAMFDSEFRLGWFSDHVIPGMQSPAVILAESIRTIFLTPIAEEAFFRGFILGQLRRVMPASLAVIVQAILFSASHLGHRSPSARLTSAFVMGVAFGAWRIRFQGLLPLMIVHGLINALAWLPLAITEYDIVRLPECRQMEALKDEPAGRAIPLIIKYLGNPDIRVRSCAHVILESRYRDSAGPYLREALSSSDIELIQATVLLAEENAFPELVPELSRIAWEHESSEAQICAIIQMMKLGDSKEIASIATDHPVPRVRRAAGRLLADPTLLSSPP